MSPFVVLLPVLALVKAVLELGQHGPLGWVAAAALVAAVGWATPRAVRRTLRWWASTKAPELPVSGAGTGRASAARPAPPAGRSAG